MKKVFRNYVPILIVWIMVSFIFGCKKEEAKNEIKDGDGNVYSTITIGTQTWLKENLKTTKLNDGTPILLVTDNTEWKELVSSGYCWYNNDVNYKNTYGALYNWNAVNTGLLCPKKYHIPTDAEWTTLVDFLGGNLIAGGKLKEAGTAHWTATNTANNSSGFSAYGAGFRSYVGPFYFTGTYSFLWSSSETGSTFALSRSLHNDTEEIFKAASAKSNGFSCRCLEDLLI